MHIRPFADRDLPSLINLTIETFRALLTRATSIPYWATTCSGTSTASGNRTTETSLPSLHDPAAGRHVAVAQTDADIVGYVAWQPGDRPASGQIAMLAVSSSQRRHGVGRRLCLHAIHEMKCRPHRLCWHRHWRRRLP